jgi:hypothetical protein
LINASCGAVLDDPLDDLSNNHPSRTAIAKSSHFARTSRGVRFFRLARVRLGFVLLVRHTASYTKPPAQGPRRSRRLYGYFPAPEAGNAATGLP